MEHQDTNSLKQISLITILSSIIMTLWFSTQHIGFTSDSTTYLQMAEYLLGNREAGAFLFFRTPGYPLLMILAGVPFLNSFTGLLMIQALMAIIIPVIIYKILLILAPRSAFLGSIFCIITFLPFAYSKVIMTEHAFIFFLILSVYLALLYWKTNKPRFLYLMLVSTVFLTFIRPSANFMFIIIISYCLFYNLKNYKHIIASFLIFFSITSTWSTWVALNLNANGTKNLISQFCQTLFMHIYRENSTTLNNLNKSNGPASTKIDNYFKQFVKQYPRAWIDRFPPRHFSNFSNKPEKFIDAVYGNPNLYYSQLLPYAIATSISANGERIITEHLMLKASLEAIANKPTLLLSFIKKFIFGSSVSFAGQQFFYLSYVVAPYASGIGIQNKVPVFNPRNIMQHLSATQELFSIITEFVYDYPQFWENREPSRIFSRYKGNPEHFLDESIIGQPSIHTFWFMWNVVDTLRGPTETSKIFMRAALENFSQSPQSLILIWDNFLSFFLGPVSNYNPGFRNIGLPSFASPHWWDDPNLQQPLKDELKSGLILHKTGLTDVFLTIWNYFFLILKPLVFLSIIATILNVVKTNLLSFIMLPVTLILYHGAVVTFFAEPMSRYVDQIFLIAILVAITAIDSTFQKNKQLEAHKQLNVTNVKTA